MRTTPRVEPPTPAGSAIAHEDPAPTGANTTAKPRIVAGALAAIVVLVALTALTNWLAQSPFVDATWREEGPDNLELAGSPLPQLQSSIGKRLLGITGNSGTAIPTAAMSPAALPRWTSSDERREALTRAQRELALALRDGSVGLRFEGTGTIDVRGTPRGLGGLGALYWLSAAAAGSLCVAGAAVLGARRGGRNALYALVTFTQAGVVLLVGIDGLPAVGQPVSTATYGALWQTALELAAAAGVMQLATLPPLRAPHRRAVVVAAWTLVAAVVVAYAESRLPGAWWWVQGLALAIGTAAVVLCTSSYRLEPNPYALLARRLVAVGIYAYTLLSLAVVGSASSTGLLVNVAAVGPTIWALYYALVLLLVPRLWRSQELMRDFSVFSAVALVATALDLLLVGVLAMDPIASLSLAVFTTLGLYAAVRRRQHAQLTEEQMADAGRRVDRLYRCVREVETRPQQAEALTEELLRDLFEPLEVQRLAQSAMRARVAAAGAALHVPLPATDSAPTASLLLRFARRGTRLFSLEDARLADQVVEQLRRALAQEMAVERGRSEERARIAQDLHDDIGARLLTLMYKAPSAEMEDYLRHTLKDLKTLTRGLASAGHRLSHAAAEWKADIGQRLEVVQIELDWSFDFDHDIALSVVQWSALTRVLRELVSNVIQHSAATHVEVAAQLREGTLRLRLADNGVGRAPEAWSHGLGLGGVRKRVKLLGGEIRWTENAPGGIVCTVLVPRLAEHRG